MKKVILNLVMVLLLISLVGCKQLSMENENPTETYESESSTIKKTEELVPEKVVLPDSLFFLTDLDPVKKNDGTYSFYGCITACKFSQYSGAPTIYITAINGSDFSMGASQAFRRIYIGNDGNQSVLLNDIVYNLSNVKGIIFEFNYNADGELINITRK